MIKSNWKQIALFTIGLAILAPIVYHVGCWILSYDPEPTLKAKSFGHLTPHREGQTLLIGSSCVCPVIPTSLCQDNFFIAPVQSANTPIDL
jgi:hypothetical protein